VTAQSSDRCGFELLLSSYSSPIQYLSRPCHSSVGYSWAFHRYCPASIPGEAKWDLWWTKCHWGGFSIRLCAMIYIPRFIKIGSGIQTLIEGFTDTHRQRGDRISLRSFLFLFFGIKKNGFCCHVVALTCGYTADRRSTPSGTRCSWPSSPSRRLGLPCCTPHNSLCCRTT
jgi:hypothetical protein